MKRRFLLSPCFLVVGATLTILTAWGCAHGLAVYSATSQSDPRSKWMGSFPSRANLWWDVSYTKRPGVRRFFTNWGDDPMQARKYYPPSSDVVPVWVTRAVESHLARGDRQEYLILDARGWPVSCLYSEANWTKRTIVRGWPLAASRQSGNRWGSANLAIPLHPIWPGFAINTIFYAAIMWLVTLGPFAMRRVIRHKRGLCIKCGYDLRGSSTGEGCCPECGAVYPAG